MKKNKSSAVVEMLKKGLSVKEIRNRMAVSESYIYLAKKKLGAEWNIPKMKETVEEAKVKLEAKFAAYMSPLKSKAETEGVGAILYERNINYGAFLDNARITQRLKAVAHQFAGQNNKTFDADQAEALDLIFTKIGRILAGNSNHIDSWIDIAGYATLVADRLQGKIR